MEVTIYEGKTNFSKLVEKAEHGEEIIIKRRNKPVARLVALPKKKQPIRLGLLSHRPFRLNEDLDADELGEEFGDLFGVAGGEDK